jgi:hypothetical protein
MRKQNLSAGASNFAKNIDSKLEKEVKKTLSTDNRIASYV